tara:strand:- start:263 stop:1339 length:1077 start_codon:yes stop_codon:yes gene_type:complete
MASQQAKQMGLVGNDHGDWYDKEGNLRAKTVGGRLQIFKGKQAAKPEQPAKKEKEEGSKEKSSDTITVGFGRFNPPTIGHEKLINTIAQTAGKGGRYRIYPSRSQDPKKNPLDASDKVNYMRQMFPDHADSIVDDEKTRTIFDVLKAAHGKGYSSVNIVVGSDRVKEFENLANKYNGQLYDFKKINIVSAGERDADAEGVEGMSASKLRKAALDDDYETFKSGISKNLDDKTTKQLYNTIRKGMKVKTEGWQVAPKLFPDTLREHYFAKKLFQVGTWVENMNHGLIGEITRRGANYVIAVTEDNIMFKSWLKDLIEVTDKDHKKFATMKYTEYTVSKVPGQYKLINKLRQQYKNYRKS